MKHSLHGYETCRTGREWKPEWLLASSACELSVMLEGRMPDRVAEESERPQREGCRKREEVYRDVIVHDLHAARMALLRLSAFITLYASRRYPILPFLYFRPRHGQFASSLQLPLRPRICSRGVRHTRIYIFCKRIAINLRSPALTYAVCSSTRAHNNLGHLGLVAAVRVHLDGDIPSPRKFSLYEPRASFVPCRQPRFFPPPVAISSNFDGH